MDINRLSRQTCRFLRPPGVVSWANVGGRLERQGPRGSYFDVTDDDSFFGKKTWEQGEAEMQAIALRRALPQIQSESRSVLPCPAVTADGDQRLAIEIERSVNVPLRKSAGVHQISEKRPRLFAGGTVIKAKAF